jgi:hypothetical protein
MKNHQRVLVFGVGIALSGCNLQPVLPDAPPVVNTPPVAVVAAAPAPTPAPPAPAPAPTPAPAPAVADDVVAVATILSEISRAMLAGGDLLRREIATATAAWNRAKTDAARLKLAGLTALASAGPSDDARALSLLEPWLGKGAEANAFKVAADILAIPLIEKLRLMREETKKADAMRERVDSLKRELDATSQKLEALRQLERNLSRRRTP